jgi:hypothetical protein
MSGIEDDDCPERSKMEDGAGRCGAELHGRKVTRTGADGWPGPGSRKTSATAFFGGQANLVRLAPPSQPTGPPQSTHN